MISKIIRQVRDQRKMPLNPQHNDFYLVEFPKSGITWLSCLLANMALSASGRKEIASFYGISQFVPDIHKTRYIADPVFNVPPVRFIKTHHSYSSDYIFIIYLTRNPLSVMKSYYRYTSEHGKQWKDFDSFVRDKHYGIRAWKRHVSSWISPKELIHRIHLIRYEDLIDNTHNELKEISTNFGWNIEDIHINHAVQTSNLINMKSSEEMGKRRNPSYSQLNAVDGSSMFPSFVIQKSTRNYIFDECASIMNILNYDRSTVLDS